MTAGSGVIINIGEMSTLALKVRHVLIPLIRVQLGYIVLYTFFDWLLFVRMMDVPVDAPWPKLIVPLILAIPLVLLTMRKPFALLNLTSVWQRPLVGFVILSVMIVGFSTVLAQYCMFAVTGKVTHLVNVWEKYYRAPTMYYTLDQRYVDKAYTGRFSTYAFTHGRGPHYYVVYEYFTVPLYSTPSDTAQHRSPLWIGVRYDTSINIDVDRPRRAFLAETFKDGCVTRFLKTDLTQFAYLRQELNEYQLRNYQVADVQSPDMRQDVDPMFLHPVQASLAEGKLVSLGWFLLSLVVGWGIWLGMIASRPFNIES